MVNFALVDFTIELRDHELTVDEGVEDNTEVICMTLDIVGGGSVECELTVGLSPAEGTASMSYFHRKGIYSPCTGTDLDPGKEDFVGGDQQFTIPPGTMSGDFCVDIEDFIRDDVILESTEYFSIHIISISPCGGIVPTYTTVNITDDDGKIIWPCYSLCHILCNRTEGWVHSASGRDAGRRQWSRYMCESGRSY